MIKQVEFLVRKDEYSHKEFVEWWQEDHADLVRDLPGLKRYTTSVPTNPDAVAYDGVLELAFEDMSTLKEAFDSETGQDVVADAADYVNFDASERMIVEETVHVDKG